MEKEAASHMRESCVQWEVATSEGARETMPEREESWEEWTEQVGGPRPLGRRLEAHRFSGTRALEWPT